MLFAIIATDHPDRLQQRLAFRSEHRARLDALQAEGRLLTAGPTLPDSDSDPMITGFSGSIIIADFPNLDDAQTWVNAEPYLAHGVYAQVDIRPYRETYGQSVAN
ncbi:MAG TPA: YciI family protein [Halothiobacillus sp.]|nr:YciI family protein [Halothiobacillus sp.]